MKNLRGIKTVVLALSAVLATASGPGLAQETPVSPEAQPLHVLVGRSVVVSMQTRLKRVLASNPAVIEAVPTSPTQVVVEAKSAGNSSLILWDETDHSRMLEVMVDLDVAGLRTAIEQAYPNQTIQAQADQGRIILSGTVPSQHVVEDLLKMAAAYSKDVVNSLVVVGPHERQILLEVKFAEVDRTKLDQLGFNFFSTGAGNTIGTISTQQFGAIGGSGGGPLSVTQATGPTTPGSTTFGLSNLLNIFLFRPDIHFGATIQALQAKNVLQILAEPNLLALNGKKASFLAGGEFPFPVVQGGQNIGAVTIQFRPFGVRLDFVGEINEDNVIRLQVAPEVSTLDYANAVTISGFTVPAIATRRADTEIELKDGESFGIAGLMDQRVIAQLNRIPGIGDIPILGELFRSKSVQRNNTELMVLVTPHVVDPVRGGAKVTSTPQAAMPYLTVPKFDENLPGHKELEHPSQPATPR